MKIKIKEIQDYLKRSWKEAKKTRVIKINDKYCKMSGFKYYFYIAKKINSLERFNNYFNSSKTLLIIKTIIIVAFFATVLIIKNKFL